MVLGLISVLGVVEVDVEVDVDVEGLKSKSIVITEFLGSVFLTLICCLMESGHNSW